MTVKTGCKRYAILIFAVFVLLFAGVIYAWSVIRAPFEEMFSTTQLSLNYTITMCSFCLFGLLSGLTAKYISSTLRLCVAALLTCGGFLLVSTVDGTSFLPLVLGYGTAAGGGIGIAYNVVISSVNAHFPDKRGLSNGVMMMGFGFSSLLFGKLGAYIFSLSSESFRNAYFWFGILIGVVLLLGALFIVPPRRTDTAAEAATQDGNYSSTQMLRRPSFWLMFLFFVLFASVGSTAISDAKGFLQAVGLAEEVIVTFVGLIAVFNGLGRICSGLFFDLAGLRRTQFLTSAVAIAATLFAFFGVFLHNPVLGVGGLLLCGFSYGFSPTVSAALCAAFYGQNHFPLNFALLNLILIPASFVPTIAKSLSIGFGPLYLILCGFSLFGLLINLIMRRA